MEKKWYQSKKFIAFLITETVLAGLASLAMVALIKQPSLGWPMATVLITLVVSIPSVAMVFNGYQAALDKYLRGMHLEKLPQMVADPFSNVLKKEPEQCGD